MINQERMIKGLIELIKIDSLSLNEREMADALKRKLSDLELPFHEDDAGQINGGNTGNIISTLKGDDTLPPILLMDLSRTVRILLGIIEVLNQRRIVNYVED